MVTAAEARTVLARSRSSPAWWIETILGAKPWAAQRQIIESVRDHRETSVKSCHGIGKDWISAHVALWFGSVFPGSLVLTTAPTDRQVRHILWHEIAQAYGKARYPLGGELLTQELRWAGSYALGFTAPDYNPDRFQGWHREQVLVIVDEAAGVTQAIMDAVSAAMTSDGARLLRIGNPTDGASEFAKSFKDPDCSKISVSAYETPNLTTFGITEEDIASGTWEAKITGPIPMPWLVTPLWVAERYKKWGPTDPRYISRVLARFPEVDPYTLIPHHWVELAQQRELPPGAPNELGVDVARYGNDDSIVGHRRGPVFRVLKTMHGHDTMQVTGAVVLALVETGATKAKVDEIGVGGGVVDRGRELKGDTVEGVNVSEASSKPEKFANLRAELWWGLRERFDPKLGGDIDIDPEDEELATQLSSVKWKLNSRGQIVIESKDDMKARGLESPDRAEAMLMAYARSNKVKIGVW